jgi:anti-sigma B factor antagonist
MSLSLPRLESRREGDRTIARVVGCDSLSEFDYEAISQLFSTLADDIPQPYVILDLSGISYASSSALGALVALNRRLRSRGGRLVLAGLCPVVAHALAIARLDTLFEILPADGLAGLPA